MLALIRRISRLYQTIHAHEQHLLHRLVATRAVEKGERILEETPLVLQEDLGLDITRSLICSACGVSAGTPSQQVRSLV